MLGEGYISASNALEFPPQGPLGVPEKGANGTSCRHVLPKSLTMLVEPRGIEPLTSSLRMMR
jgi:hypothetical protein